MAGHAAARKCGPTRNHERTTGKNQSPEKPQEGRIVSTRQRVGVGAADSAYRVTSDLLRAGTLCFAVPLCARGLMPLTRNADISNLRGACQGDNPVWYRSQILPVPMQLRYSDPSLQMLAESSARLDAHFGPDDGALVRQRICELMAADNLAVAASVPTLDLKPVTSETDDFSVVVRPHLRMVFKVAAQCSRGSANDQLDLASVETIHILAIEECDEP